MDMNRLPFFNLHFRSATQLVPKKFGTGLTAGMNRCFYTVALAAIFVMLFSGCSRRSRNDSPRERNELVMRFFSSLKSDQPEAAVRQGEKLLMMDPTNTFLPTLIQIQQSNSFMARAQNEVNRGDINAALAIIAEGLRHYPDNSTLHDAQRRLRQLRNAPRLISAMRRARSASAMNAALTAATIGLSGCTTPKLEAYFQEYEKRIAAATAAEEEERRSKIEHLESEVVAPLPVES